MLTSFLLISCLLTGEPADNAALKTEVQKLVNKLDDDSRDVRATAEKRLMELGPAVLDYLPSAESQQNENVRESLRGIRKTLQERVAAKSVEASTVTLQGRLTVSKALAEIQKQTGNKLGDPPRTADATIPEPEIAVRFDKTPFWTALDAVLDQAQLSIYPYGQPGVLQIVPRAANDLPRTGRAAVQGPLRIEPVSVTAKRELRSSSPPALQITLEVAWEPRLQPISVKQRVADLKVLDSNGGSLAAEDPPQAEKEAFPRAGCSAAEMDVSLAMPARPLREIASLKGSMQMMMLGKVETFRFADLLKGKQEKRIAAAMVAVDEVRKNGDSWEVFVRLRFDEAGDALESHRNWVLQNEAYLEDAAGKPIQYDSMETTQRTKTEIGVGYVFAMAELPKDGKFVYKTPGIVVTRDYPYEVKGIKMP